VNHRKHRNKPPASPPEADERWLRAVLRPLVSVLSLGAVLAGAAYGLEQLKNRLYALPEYNPPINFELAQLEDVPWVEKEGWRPRILHSIHLPANRGGSESELLENIARQLEASGWVSRVRRVWKETHGTIRLACEYRRPIAMLETSGGRYIPVDKDGVRLPEVYDRVPSELGWMRIVGVQSEIPEVGTPFRGSAGDAVAAVRLAALLFDQPQIGPQISRIDVSNFDGRRDRRENHIRLWTRDGRRIDWGSAIGREMEEATVEQKLRNLVLLLKNESAQARADISTYPNTVRVYWDEQGR